MKVIILAGGLGTRLSEYTKSIPKPMVKIAGKPIIIRIIEHYLKYGFNNFYIATGYKSKVIKKYFKNFRKSGHTFNYRILKEKIKITIVDTGLNTMTGGRLKRVAKYLKDDENFMFTYGDGLSNVNLINLKKLHIRKKKLITLTAVRPPARFGELKLKKNLVKTFKEKPQTSEGWINGGFFIAKTSFLKLIKNDNTILEKEPLEIATQKKELMAYTHKGFWKCMDVKRDRDVLNKIFKKRFNEKKF